MPPPLAPIRSRGVPEFGNPLVRIYQIARIEILDLAERGDVGAGTIDRCYTAVFLRMHAWRTA